MTKKHTVSFDPDGVVQYTRSSTMDKVFEGAGEMERITDISKVPNEPLYYIKWLKGPYEGLKHKAYMADEYGVNCGNDCFLKFDGSFYTKDHIICFHSYEDAVAHEIDMINAMRMSGVRF